MKNISLFLNIALLIAVILLYVDRFSGNKKTSSSDVKNDSAANTKIAYIRLDSLMNNYDFYNDLKTEFMEKQKNHEGNLSTKSKALERRMMEYQDKTEKGLVTRAQAQKLAEEIQLEQQNLLAMRDRLQMDLAQEEQAMSKRISDSIAIFVKDFNKDKKYDYILNFAPGATMFFATETANITDAVIKSLNKRYNSANPKKK